MGRNDYLDWPSTRNPAWQPCQGWDGEIDKFQRYFFFYDCLAPHIFLFHVMGKGLMYEAPPLNGFNAELAFRDFYTSFLCASAGVPRVANADPQASLQVQMNRLSWSTSDYSVYLCDDPQNRQQYEVRRFRYLRHVMVLPIS